MGYYTSYTLSVYGLERKNNGLQMTYEIPPDTQAKIEREIEKMNVFSDGSIYDAYYVKAKWYEHDDDMRLLSSRFPDNLFWLCGSGDDLEDMWQKFYVGGRMQEDYARIVYHDFDEDMLDHCDADDIEGREYSCQIDFRDNRSAADDERRYREVVQRAACGNADE